MILDSKNNKREDFSSLLLNLTFTTIYKNNHMTFRHEPKLIVICE
jgi:hypothetical protein